MPRPPFHADLSLALALSGGNALGAYHAGAYQALRERGWLPDWVAGASAGAINGAVIAGNPPDRRLERLAALWEPAQAAPDRDAPTMLDQARRTSAAAATMAMGKPGLFVPRALYGPGWNPFGNPEPSSLYDATPLERTLEAAVDFELLNHGPTRYCATAIDVETGEDVVLDTRTHQVTPRHVRASAALLPAFSPVEVEGRWLGDGGISANLPLDVVLGSVGERPLLCIAVDLLPLRGPRPTTLGETIIRMQDLMFASQSRRALAAWQAIFDARTAAGDRRAAMVVHIAYSDHHREVSGKAFDFSPESARVRWQAGYDDAQAALAAVDVEQVAGMAPGLRVLSAAAGREDGAPVPTRQALAPQPA